MRRRELSVALASALFAFADASRADECLDASERARGELQAKHLLAARAELRVCASSTCEELVRRVCEERLGEVVQRLSSVVFDVKDERGNDLADVVLTVDGATVTQTPGSEVTLDPGPHSFDFRSGARTETRTFVLLEREKGRRESITFASPTPVITYAPSPAISTRMEPRDRPGPWRTIGAIAMGAGAVGLGIGTAFGVLAITQNADADCDARNVCADPRSRHDARTAAQVSTASFVSGGAIAICGLALFLLAPKGR